MGNCLTVKNPENGPIIENCTPTNVQIISQAKQQEFEPDKNEIRFWRFAFLIIDNSVQNEISLLKEFNREFGNTESQNSQMRNSIQQVDWSLITGLEIKQQKPYGYRKTLKKLPSLIKKAFGSVQNNIRVEDLTELCDLCDKVIKFKAEQLKRKNVNKQNYNYIECRKILKDWEEMSDGLNRIYYNVIRLKRACSSSRSSIYP